MDLNWLKTYCIHSKILKRKFSPQKKKKCLSGLINPVSELKRKCDSNVIYIRGMHI